MLESSEESHRDADSDDEHIDDWVMRIAESTERYLHLFILLCYTIARCS